MYFEYSPVKSFDLIVLKLVVAQAWIRGAKPQLCSGWYRGVAIPTPAVLNVLISSCGISNVKTRMQHDLSVEFSSSY
jgi:hypothetical protein